MTKYILRFSALAYLGAVVMLPVLWVFKEALIPNVTLHLLDTSQSWWGLSQVPRILGHDVGQLGNGVKSAWSAAKLPFAAEALKLTLKLALIAVVANTIFGVAAALLIVRHRFRGVEVLNLVVDIPLGLSPVVVGLSLLLVYGNGGWLGPWLTAHGLTVIYAFPSMAIATVFVTLPFVVREVIPVVREVGTGQEEAARTLGASAWYTFWRITLPAIRAGVVYGVVLTMARAIGEYGAVSVVSSNIQGATQSLTMYVDNEYTNYDYTGAYVASVELAVIAVLTLIILTVVRKRGIEDA